MRKYHALVGSAVFSLGCILCGLLFLAGCRPSDATTAKTTPNTTPKTQSPENPPAEKSSAVAKREEPAKENSPAWQKLFDGKTLEGWKITPFGKEGPVKVEDGAILMETGDPMTGVTWTGEPPQENYELELEGKRVRESDFFCTTTFPVGKKPCSLVVGGWGGSVVGLSNVDGYDAAENPTTKTMQFKQNTWYRVRIRVTEKLVQAWIDDREMVHQAREGHRFGIRFEVDKSRPLGIAAWNTTGAVREIRLRKLTNEEIAAGMVDVKEDGEEDP